MEIVENVKKDPCDDSLVSLLIVVEPECNLEINMIWIT